MRPKKTALLIAQRIAREISEGQVDAGSVLASERDMLAQYGVGRGSLREALRVLEQHGVIMMRPGAGGGPVVLDPSPEDLAGSLALALQMSRTPFSAIVDARVLIEPEMAAQAAVRATPAQLEEMAASVERMRAELHDLEQFLDHNARFHHLIASASGNRVFAYVLGSLHRITDGTPLGVSYDERRRLAVLAAHERISGAIREKDAAKARDAMARHVGEFHKFMAKFYPTLMDRPIRWDQVVA